MHAADVANKQVYTALSKLFPDTTGSLVTETTFAEDVRDRSPASAGSVDVDYEEKADEGKTSGVVVSTVPVV